MTGHLRERTPGHWQLKLDIGRDAAGKRITEFHTYRGTKRDAPGAACRTGHRRQQARARAAFGVDGR